MRPAYVYFRDRNYKMRALRVTILHILASIAVAPCALMMIVMTTVMQDHEICIHYLLRALSKTAVHEFCRVFFILPFKCTCNLHHESITRYCPANN